jgi:hypothetical protein
MRLVQAQSRKTVQTSLHAVTAPKEPAPKATHATARVQPRFYTLGYRIQKSNFSGPNGLKHYEAFPACDPLENIRLHQYALHNNPSHQRTLLHISQESMNWRRTISKDSTSRATRSSPHLRSVKALRSSKRWNVFQLSGESYPSQCI